MASQERGQGADLRERLRQEFYRYRFFQAVALVERLAAGKKAVGEALRPGEEPIRFKVRPGFAFPASDITGFRVDQSTERVEMEVSFLGLIGPHGVLPQWYNELAQERARNKDPSLTEFLDLFHHRLLSLFYLAWRRSHIASQVTSGATDRFSLRFRRLIGISAAGSTVPPGLDVETLLHFSGLLARQIPTASAIEAAARHYSGQQAAVEQFIERTLELPVEEQTVLGRANSVLGGSAICGSQIKESMSKFRVDLGPMGRDDFLRFLPGAGMLRQLFALVRFIVGIEYEFDLCIILKRGEVPPCRLGGTDGFAPRLGWNSWLKTPETELHKDQRVTFQESDLVRTAAA